MREGTYPSDECLSTGSPGEDAAPVPRLCRPGGALGELRPSWGHQGQRAEGGGKAAASVCTRCPGSL